MALSEREILARHTDALTEAKAECRWLGSQIDRDNAAPRGRHYEALKKALKAAEGSARQMGYHRSDARWFKLGVLYAKILRKTQQWYVGQKWATFTQIMPMFDGALRDMQNLQFRRTGLLTSQPILLTPASMGNMIIPDWRNPWQGDHGGRMN